MIEQLLSEFKGINLGDKRRESRVLGLLSGIHSAPSLSFPRMFPETAELEAFYRFIESPYISSNDIKAPHISATLKRAKDASGKLIVVHDSTKFSFSGSRKGLISDKSGETSFFGHCSLLINHDQGEPLGVLRMDTWVRENQTRKSAKKAGLSKEEINNIPSEHARWLKGIQSVSSLSEDISKAIHVCDSEGDSYELISSLLKNDLSFIIRGCQDRRIVDDCYKKLKLKLAASSILVDRKVPLSKRVKSVSSSTKRNSPRKERTATLGFASNKVTIIRPETVSKEMPKHIDLNVVYVKEVNPPQDCESVEWILLTSQPVENNEDILQVIDIYRNRWIIEEYFKALKTGCAYEVRQLESYHTLQNCLALFIPMAWLMLFMRAASRQNNEVPVEDVLPPLYLKILRAHTGKTISNAKDALWAIAAMGGHIKNNGPPGWLTLWRGIKELVTLVKGYLIAQTEKILNVNKKM